jgi:hypothetical protein
VFFFIFPNKNFKLVRHVGMRLFSLLQHLAGSARVSDLAIIPRHMCPQRLAKLILLQEDVFTFLMGVINFFIDEFKEGFNVFSDGA